MISIWDILLNVFSAIFGKKLETVFDNNPIEFISSISREVFFVVCFSGIKIYLVNTYKNILSRN